MLTKPKHVLQGPMFFPSSPFVNSIVESARTAADKDRVISIRSDNTAKTVVTLTASWIAPHHRALERRIYIDRDLMDSGHARLTFMGKAFDPKAVSVGYDLDDPAMVAQVGKDIVHYLRMGIMPS